MLPSLLCRMLNFCLHEMKEPLHDTNQNPFQLSLKLPPLKRLLCVKFMNEARAYKSEGLITFA